MAALLSVGHVAALFSVTKSHRKISKAVLSVFFKRRVSRLSVGEHEKALPPPRFALEGSTGDRADSRLRATNEATPGVCRELIDR
jgi:hypothetical protein